MCNVKGVVYEAVCLQCDAEHRRGQSVKHCGRYVGQTAQTLYERSRKHLQGLKNHDTGGFAFKHWALVHPDSPVPPGLSFSVVKKHKDPLSRQLREAVVIGKKGGLNKKNEFGLNELIRLNAPTYSWDQEQTDLMERRAKSDHEIKLSDFVTVMSNVRKCDYMIHDINRDIDYRLSQTKCTKRPRGAGDLSQPVTSGNKKSKMIHTSTLNRHL